MGTAVEVRACLRSPEAGWRYIRVGHLSHVTRQCHTGSTPPHTAVSPHALNPRWLGGWCLIQRGMFRRAAKSRASLVSGRLGKDADAIGEHVHAGDEIRWGIRCCTGRGRKGVGVPKLIISTSRRNRSDLLCMSPRGAEIFRADRQARREGRKNSTPPIYISFAVSTGVRVTKPSFRLVEHTLTRSRFGPQGNMAGD